MKIEALAAPGKIGSMELKNRIVVPSINNNYTHAAFMTQRSVDSYAAKARGGAGLIITEATSVDYPRSRSVMNPAIDDDKYMPMQKKVVEECHRYGAKIVVQLSHVGRQTKKASSGMDPVAPSPIGGNSPLYPDKPRVLTLEDIAEIIEKYGDAADRARRCGFDGCEIIMGHGYLCNNFLSPLSNKREDEYGGLKGGIHYCTQIVRTIRERCGKDFAIICRINGDDFAPKDGNTIVEAQLIAQELEKAGADAINVSGGMRDSEQNFNDHTAGTPHASWLSMAERIRRGLHIPVISVKRYTPELAEEAVASGKVDFVAFGKQSIADPEFARKILEERTEDMIPCMSCSQGCYDRLWMWIPITCLANPEAGMTEEEISSHRAHHSNRRILVVGAGPAGCELAIELASLGNRVTLIDREGAIGGSYRYAAGTRRKQEIENLFRYWRHRMVQLGVEVRLSTAFASSMLSDYEAVVDATGAEFVKPAAGEDVPPVFTPPEALDAPEKLGKYAVILTCDYGCAWTCHAIHNELPDDIVGSKTNETSACAAGFAAADLAEELAEQGKKVEILTGRKAFAEGMGFTNRNYMQKRFFTKNISVSNSVKILNLVPGGLRCEKEGMEFFVAADSIIASGRLISRDTVGSAAKAAGCPCFSVGDAEKIGNALEAIRNSYKKAEEICDYLQ